MRNNERNAYVEKMQARIDALQADIDKLAAKAGSADASARIELDRKLAQITHKQAESRARLAELRDSGEEAWRELRTGAERAWQEFSRAVSNARKHLS